MNLRLLLGLAIVALAAACGGGGGGGSGAPSSIGLTTSPTNAPGANAPATNSPLPAGYARASVSITVPKGTGSASNSRRAQNVGTGTNSITFTLLQQSAGLASPSPQTFGLTATSPGCSTNTAGNLVCTLSVSAPVGNDIFLAQTYTGTNGSGSLTGSGAVSLSVAQNSTNTASLSLSGQVATVYLAAGAPYPYLGSYGLPASVARRNAAAAATPPPVSSLQIFVIALDSQNNIILNPSVFTSPVYIQLLYGDQNTPDVLLTVVPGFEGGPTQTASLGYGSVAVNSPTDTITASIIPNVANPSFGVFLAGNIGSPLLALNAPYPVNPPIALVTIPVNEVSAPSGVISLYDTNAATSVTSVSMSGTTTDTLVPSELGFTGNFALSAPSCAGIITLNLTNSGNGVASIAATAIASGSCTAIISDGTNNLTVPITVTVPALFLQDTGGGVNYRFSFASYAPPNVTYNLEVPQGANSVNVTLTAGFISPPVTVQNDQCTNGGPGFITSALDTLNLTGPSPEAMPAITVNTLNGYGNCTFVLQDNAGNTATVNLAVENPSVFISRKARK